MNKVILIGRVGKDPETRSVNEKTVANITLATSKSYKNSTGERVTNTEWHRLTAWSPIADIFEKYVKKGDQIAVEGEIQTRSYDDNEGVKRHVTEIIVRNLELLGGNKSEGKSETETKHSDQDQLPF